MATNQYRAVVVAIALSLSGAVLTARAQVGKDATPAVIPVDQQPTRQQLDNLFEVMRVKDQLGETNKMMPAIIQQQFSQQFAQMKKDLPGGDKLSPEQEQALQAVMAKFVGRAASLYTAEEMVADMGALYQKHLSRSDVDGMIGFYSSPAGQHMIAMIPVIMQEFMPTVMQKTQERMRPLVVEMSKEAAQIANPGAQTQRQK